MSTNSISMIQNFYDYLKVHQEAGKSFAELLNECSKGLEDSKEYLEKVVTFAKKYGFKFSSNELMSFLDHKRSELSEEELEQIVGGISQQQAFRGVSILSFLALPLVSLYSESSSFFSFGGSTTVHAGTGISATAAASEIQTFIENGLTFKIVPQSQNNEVRIIKYTGNSKKITIPNTIKYGGITYQITEIDRGCFKNCKSLNQIDLSNTFIRELPAECFMNCTSLQAISIPNSVETIGESCFALCSSLTTISPLLNHLTTLGEACFLGCGALKSIDFSNTYVKKFPSKCFQDCRNLSNISLKINADEEYQLSDAISNLIVNCKNRLIINLNGNENYSRKIIEEIPLSQLLEIKVNEEKISRNAGYDNFKITEENGNEIPSGTDRYQLLGANLGYNFNDKKSYFKRQADPNDTEGILLEGSQSQEVAAKRENLNKFMQAAFNKVFGSTNLSQCEADFMKVLQQESGIDAKYQSILKIGNPTTTTGVYGNQEFYNQVNAHLTSGLAFLFEQYFSNPNGMALDQFLSKIEELFGNARNAIAIISNSKGCENFGQATDNIIDRLFAFDRSDKQLDYLKKNIKKGYYYNYDNAFLKLKLVSQELLDDSKNFQSIQNIIDSPFNIINTIDKNGNCWTSDRKLIIDVVENAGRLELIVDEEGQYKFDENTKTYKNNDENKSNINLLEGDNIKRLLIISSHSHANAFQVSAYQFLEVQKAFKEANLDSAKEKLLEYIHTINHTSTYARGQGTLFIQMPRALAQSHGYELRLTNEWDETKEGNQKALGTDISALWTPSKKEFVERNKNNIALIPIEIQSLREELKKVENFAWNIKDQREDMPVEKDIARKYTLKTWKNNNYVQLVRKRDQKVIIGFNATPYEKITLNRVEIPRKGEIDEIDQQVRNMLANFFHPNFEDIQ